MVTFLSEQQRTARKDHRCWLCGDTIRRGAAYTVTTYVDTTVYDIKTCPHCSTEVCGFVAYAVIDEWEGYGPEDAYWWATEDAPHSHNLEERDAAARYLQRVVRNQK